MMEVILSGDNASQLSAKLAGNFGNGSGIQEIESTDYASGLVSKVNDNFELLNEAGDGVSRKFRFLHISDLHGYADALENCVDMMEDDSRYKFLLVTGDLTKYTTNNITTDIDNALKAIPSGKLLMRAGNHEIWDLKSGSQANVTSWLYGYVGDAVNWGDTDGENHEPDTASYWYKDYPIGDNKLRIISIDQYETTAVRNPGRHYTVYSQEQIDWFFDCLDDLGADDFLIIVTHDPPVQNQSSGATSPDSYAQAMANIGGDSGKLFVTSGLYAWTSKGDEPSLNLFPRIMKAYMHKQSLSMTYNNKGGDSSEPDITISKDFTSANPCTFLFFIGGHMHADVAYYLPDESQASRDGGDWSDQLMLYVTAADRGVNYSYYDDLGGNGSDTTLPSNPSSDTYRINEVVLDFEDKTIRVIRHGDKNTSDGRTRTAITFPFKKQ